MASYNELLALIDAYINQNGVQAITGQVLNGVLRAMVDQLGRGYTIMGTADPTTDPGTPDGPESWFASTPGTYTNFDGLTVANAELALLSYTPSDGFSKTTLTQGIVSTAATVDNNVGTPSVTSSYVNGVLTFTFQNLKGNTGDPAGFGTVSASVDGNIGTPGVQVQTSGPDTAKNMVFQFTNLKGETGVTSVVATVDNTSGNPQCAVSLNGQQLTLAFTGLKGAQGDTGSSVDYPFTIVNNLTTNDATQALSAAMGVQLESEVSQLEAEVNGNEFALFNEGKLSAKYVANSYVDKTNGNFTAYNGWTRTDYINVYPFTKISIYSPTSSTYNAFYDKDKVFISAFTINAGTTAITIPNNACYLVISNTTANAVLATFTIVEWRFADKSVVESTDAKIGDLADLLTPENTSVVEAINSMFEPAPNLININNLSQKWKDTDITWSVSDGVLNIVNGNSGANKGVEFYLPNLDSAKSYTIKYAFSPSDKLLSSKVWFSNYQDGQALTIDGGIATATFTGGNGFFLYIFVKPSANINITGLSLTEDGVASGISHSLLVDIPKTSLDEESENVIDTAITKKNYKDSIINSFFYDYDKSKQNTEQGDNSLKITNITGSNAGSSFAVAVIPGAKYKIAFTSDSTKFMLGVTSAEHSVLVSNTLAVVGSNLSAEFTVPDGFGKVFVNIILYGGYTANITNLFLVRTDKMFVPEDAYFGIPADVIKRRYFVPCPYLYYDSTGDNIDFFTNGYIDTDTKDGEYTLRCLDPTIYAFTGALGPGFYSRFRLKVDATGPKPGSTSAYVYDKFGFASPVPFKFIDTGAPSNPGSQKNILMIGDSLTSRLYLPCYFKKYLNDNGLTNWNMVGRVTTSQHQDIATDVHFEANGGYAWPNYVDDPATLPAEFPNNYFWDANEGHISIQYYMDTYCNGASPDIVLCNIGWNQFVNGNYSSMTMDEMKVKVKTFLDTLHSEYPNCKAVLTGIQRGHPNSKDCNHQYYIESQMKLARAYQDIAEDADYKGWVIYGNIAPYFDGTIGLQTEQRSISMFTPATEEYVLEEVHPNETGYKMFAFALYLHFLYLANL